MSSKIAAQKCPQLIFVYPNFEKYKTVSNQVMEIFHRFTDLVEPLSLDEAYLDVTENKMNIPVATDIAKEIKKLIQQETNLTASAGVSYCKFLAKVASGFKKPDGLTVVTPKNADAFIEKLPIEDFYGIGKVTAEKMKQRGIHKGSDLKSYELDELIEMFGIKSGTYYYEIARGIDERNVHNDHIRRSIGAEETFETDIDELELMKNHLDEITDDVFRRCTKNESFGKTITLKIKYKDFVVNTRSKTFDHFISTKDELFTIALDLLQTPEKPIKAIRLLGISVSNLNTDPETKIDKQLKSLQLKLELKDEMI
jgi:DNA polymerase-4